MSELILNGHDELLVDNFAGGGGASTGIELALARAVDIAINHDCDALAMHRANHPETHHECEDVWRVDPEKITAGKRVGAAWFSPDCTDFSKAKGGKPLRKKIRGLAWVMVKWAALKRPRVLFLENVEEFQHWGPLRADGQRCPKRKGKTFRSFVGQLRRMGYEVDWRELRACDYGAPTSRKRLFLIARCDGSPIIWPRPTHGKPGSPEVESGACKPWRTAAECIDFSLPCPSIFLTKGDARKMKLRVIRPLAPATMRRIARGIFKFVIENPKPFIVKVNHTGYEQFRGQSIDVPLQTITAKHPYAVVSPHITKFRTGATGSKIDNPLPTITAGPKKNPAGAAHAMGMVTAFLSAHIERQFGESKGNPIDQPLGTTVAGANKSALVTSNLVKLRGTNTGQKTDEPLATVSAGGTHHAEVRAFLMKYYTNGTAKSFAQDLNEPMHTIRSKACLGLVTVEGEDYQIVDIGMRMLEPRELFLAQGFPPDYEIEHVNGKRLPKNAQVRMCGNSVPPPMSEALVAANVPELRKRRKAA